MSEPTYRIHVAAELSGVSQGLIRAWERRYGVLKPRRTPSGYRAYSSADIELLKRLKRLTADGVSIGEAVKVLPRLRREVKNELAHREGPRRLPGSEQLTRWRDQVLDAATLLDQQRVERVFEEAMASLPPLQFFDDVLMPIQQEIGDRWHAGVIAVAEEHVVTQVARQCVLTLLHQAPRRARFHALCACFPHEDHELGLLGAALRFRHAGWRVTFLGARTPVEHLARVARELRPDVVALSCVVDEGAASFGQTLGSAIARLPLATRVVVGGATALKYRRQAEQARADLLDSSVAWAALLESAALGSLERRSQ